MHLIDGHILRQVRGNTVLVPPPEKEIGFNGMISLNHTGAFVCKLLCEDIDRHSIVCALAKQYGVETNSVEADVDEFLSVLSSCNMLVE